MEPETGPRGLRTLLVVALLAAIYAGYARALDGELQFDDLRLLNENRAVKDLPHYLGTHFVAQLRIAGRALTYLTFAINYHLSALEVRPYHLVNLGTHLLCVLAVLALSLAILKRAGWRAPFAPALLTAALFGLHPIQSQAVAYVFQRAEVLGSLFYVLTLLCALSAEERGRTPAGAAAYAGALVSFFLGWCSKPMVATLPAAILLLLAAFPAPRHAERRLRARAPALLAFSLPFWAMTAAFASRLFGGLRGSGEAGFSVATMTPWQYFLTQPRVILTYLRLMVWPAGQNVDWEFPPSTSLAEPRTALSFLAILVILAAAIWFLRRATPASRLAGVGILWFFLLLAPTSTFVTLKDVIEEHRVYLACWGLFLPAAAAGLLFVERRVQGQRSALAGGLVGAALCAALLFALYQRTAVWETAVSLWSDVVAKSPGKARGHMNLGYALVDSDTPRALAETRAAERLAADGSINTDELRQNLAGILLRLGRRAEAIAVLQGIAAREESPNVLTNLAIAHLESGNLEEARRLALRTVAKWPQYGPAWHTLGQLDSAAHDYRSAAVHFGRAADLDPDSLASLASLAATEQLLGDRPAACATWARAARSGVAGAVDVAARARTSLGCE